MGWKVREDKAARMGWNKDEGEAGAAKFNCTLAKNKEQRVKHKDECEDSAQWNEGKPAAKPATEPAAEPAAEPDEPAEPAAKPAAKPEASVSSDTKTALVNATVKEVVVFLKTFQGRVSPRFQDMDVLFALTLLDPSNLQYETRQVSLAKVEPLFNLTKNLNFKDVTDATLRRSVGDFVAGTGRLKEVKRGFPSGQDSIKWHRNQLVIGRREHAQYHEFALSLLPFQLINAKAESVFSGASAFSVKIGRVSELPSSTRSAWWQRTLGSKFPCTRLTLLNSHTSNPT